MILRWSHLLLQSLTKPPNLHLSLRRVSPCWWILLRNALNHVVVLACPVDPPTLPCNSLLPMTRVFSLWSSHGVWKMNRSRDSSSIGNWWNAWLKSTTENWSEPCPETHVSTLVVWECGNGMLSLLSSLAACSSGSIYTRKRPKSGGSLGCFGNFWTGPSLEQAKACLKFCTLWY